MTERARRSRFASRPSDGETRIKSIEGADACPRQERRLHRAPDDRRHLRTARRIKVAAFQCGVTAADMLRDLLVKAFPAVDGGTP
jgi:hypothetical protein